MGHLEGAGDTRIDGKCDVWVCLEERSIGTSRLSEEDHPPNHLTFLGSTVYSSEDLSRTERQRKGKSALCWSWDGHLLPGDIGPQFLGLWTWPESPPQLPWASSLQTTDGRTSQNS